LKLRPGGLVDLEFVAQYLQLAGAARGGPLRQNTGEALEALAQARPALATSLRALRRAWELQADLSQVLKIALDDRVDPTREPTGLHTLLARAGGAESFASLRQRLARSTKGVRAAFDRILA